MWELLFLLPLIPSLLYFWYRINTPTTMPTLPRIPQPPHQQLQSKFDNLSPTATYPPSKSNYIIEKIGGNNQIILFYNPEMARFEYYSNISVVSHKLLEMAVKRYVCVYHQKPLYEGFRISKIGLIKDFNPLCRIKPAKKSVKEWLAKIN